MSLTSIFDKLLGLSASCNSGESLPWWTKVYEEANSVARFGPAERNELGRLIDKLNIELFPNDSQKDAPAVPLSYTALHGYLCCIVVGPPGLPCSAWLPSLLRWPVESTPPYLRLLALMRLMAADIEKDFQRPKPQLRLPALGVSQGPATKVAGPPLLGLDEWCFAFLQAEMLQPKKWAKFGQPDAGDGNLLEPFWHYGTAEGQRHWEEDRHRFYRSDGHSESAARQMVAREMLSPHTVKSQLATVRQSLREFWDYWRGGIDVFKRAESGEQSMERMRKNCEAQERKLRKRQGRCEGCPASAQPVQQQTASGLGLHPTFLRCPTCGSCWNKTEYGYRFFTKEEASDFYPEIFKDVS